MLRLSEERVRERARAGLIVLSRNTRGGGAVSWLGGGGALVENPLGQQHVLRRCNLEIGVVALGDAHRLLEGLDDRRIVCDYGVVSLDKLKAPPEQVRLDDLGGGGGEGKSRERGEAEEDRELDGERETLGDC